VICAGRSLESNGSWHLVVSKWLCTFASLALLLLTPSISFADTDQYYYNGNNQLVETVNDTTGHVVTYSYDANGSVVAINAVTANALTISGFTPVGGSIGNQVTIYGTGFDPVAGNNVVAINGTYTLVSSASPTKLVTSVPTGASTGPITVSNPIGSATSASNFIVNGSSGGSGGPIATLNPHALSFLALAVGSASTTQSITLTNTGGADLHFSTPLTYGAHANDFSITSNTCASALIANASCAISISFAPGATGNRSAALIIFSDATNGSQSVTLSGVGAVGTAVVTPGALTFADQLINTTGATQNVTVTNSGGSALTVSNVTFTGNNAGDFVVATNGCSVAVAAGASCAIGIAFHPTATGARTGTLQIASDASNGVQQVSLGGAGIAPAASMAPSSLSFGNQLLGATSTSRSLTITNSGTAPLTVGAVTIGGTNPGDYLVSGNTCTSAIAVNAACAISVTFTPTATGSSAATLQVSTDAATGTQWIPLTGTGIAPLISVTPASNAFGNVLINTVSAAKTFTVTNSGSAPLTVGMLSFSGVNASDFTISNVVCAGTLAIGANCTISATFRPAATGLRVATLQIESDANNGVQQVSLSGTGVAPAASAAPASVSFGNQLLNTTSTAQVVTVTNTGTSPLTVGTLSLSGSNPADFSVTANTCIAAVPVAANCAVSVTFHPTATGVRAANLQIASDANNGTQQVSLTGTSVAPIASASPASLAFGNQLVSADSPAKVVTITNSGSSPLTVGTPTFTGTDNADFMVSANTCTAAVDVSQNCSISVIFTPGAAGSRSATLQIPSDANNGVQTVSLTGTGIVAIAAASPATLSYGNQLLNAASSAQVITVTNSGQSPLTISGTNLTGSNTGDFAVTGNSCSTALNYNASCTIGVAFTPAATGARNATLNIASNASNGVQTVALTGTGTAPNLSVAPGSLGFGNQLLNSASTVRTLTLTNSGTAPLNIGTLTLSGSNASNFAANGCSGTAVAVGANCTVSLTFTPSAIGSRSATLQIASDATSGTQTISLSGTGIAPSISASASAITFSNVVLNTASAGQTFTLTNTGTAPLTVGSLALSGANSGDFAVSSNTCGSAVAVGSDCTVGVTFTPSALGGRSAQLSIPSDATNGTQTVSLSGTGVAPSIGISSVSLSYGNQLINTSSTAQTVVVTNTGSAPLHISSVSFSGTNPGDFTATGCTSAVAAGSSCNLNISFIPSAVGGRSATVSVISDALNGTQSATLAGTGIAPSASISPATQDLGLVAVLFTSSPATYTVKNTGTATLNIGTPTLTGANASEFFIYRNNCTAPLAPSQTCTILLRYSPTSGGAKSATLVVPSDAMNGTQTANASGTALGL